jgi:hypothetical protein
MPGQPWPTYEESERVQALARRKVEELAPARSRVRGRGAASLRGQHAGTGHGLVHGERKAVMRATQPNRDVTKSAMRLKIESGACAAMCRSMVYGPRTYLIHHAAFRRPAISA